MTIRQTLAQTRLGRSAGTAALGLLLTAGWAATADAHRSWMLPSATVLSGEDVWVTVDAAVSNELFYFEFVPLRLDGLTITGPDGKPVEPQNVAEGRYRNTFDVPLTQEGTYNVALVGDGAMAFWREGEENRRWRGTLEDFRAQDFSDAEGLRVMQTHSRVEFFSTLGAPSDTVVQPEEVGLEVLPKTHPNDLYTGENTTFRVLLDGEPVPGAELEIVKGGSRYRDDGGAITVTTNEAGTFDILWPEPGMYFIEASAEGGKSLIEGATRRANYSGVFEVLPQ